MRKSIFFVILLNLLLLLSSKYYVANAEEVQNNFSNQGYVGTLPDLSRNIPIDSIQQKHPEMIQTKDFNSENELKPIPRDNPTFVNIILKSDKTSQYLNDLNEFIPLLESLYDLIENESKVQIFNAKVYFFNKSAEYFRDKYTNRPESNFVSYRRVMELSTHARSIALLRTEACRYNPYLAYGSSGYIYNPNNLTEQLGYLKDEIQKTIVLLKESN